MGDRYVVSDANKKIIYIVTNLLYGHSGSQPLPCDEIKFDKNMKLEDILNTRDDSDIGYFLVVYLLYPDNIKEKPKNFPFCPENEKFNPEDFTPYMNENKPNIYTQTRKLLCDWTDKKRYLIHYRWLKLFV